MTNINTDLKGFLSLPPVSGAKKKALQKIYPCFFLTQRAKSRIKPLYSHQKVGKAKEKWGKKVFLA
jgi:hypothetical protein